MNIKSLFNRQNLDKSFQYFSLPKIKAKNLSAFSCNNMNRRNFALSNYISNVEN